MVNGELFGMINVCFCFGRLFVTVGHPGGCSALYGRPMELGRPLYFHAVVCSSSSSFFFLFLA